MFTITLYTCDQPKKNKNIPPKKRSFHQLVEQQRKYFLTGKPATLVHRRAQLKKLHEVILAQQEMLTAAVYKDLRRKPQTYLYELAPILTEINYMLGHLEEWCATTKVGKTFVTLLDTPEIFREPKRGVLIIGTWNCPLYTLLMPLVAVLAAGNTALIKPSEVAPHTAQAIDLILSKTFEKKYLAVAQGGVKETSALF